MASVDNTRELSNVREEAQDIVATPEPEISAAAAAASSNPTTTTNQQAASRLAPAPMPESNPWKREVRLDSPVRVSPDAFATRDTTSQGPTAPPKKTTGKEKWVPFTPVVNSNAPAPRRDRNKRKQRSQKTPEADNREKASSPSPAAGTGSAANATQSPTTGGNDNGNTTNNNGSNEKEKFKQQRQPRKKYIQQQAQSSTPYDMTLSLLVQQFDYYFSIENLCKDIFLRKQMNSKGFIPLQILTDFNRVRILSNGDINVVTEACKWCPATEVVGNKVRLASGWERWVLPVEDRDAPGRSDSESDDDTPRFHIDKAVPFVPKRSQ